MLDLSRYSESPVSESEAVIYARKIGALEYIECSALTQQNLKEVFDTAILATLGSMVRRQSKVMFQEFRGRKSFRKLKEKIKRSNSTTNANTHQQQQINSQSVCNSLLTQSTCNNNFIYDEDPKNFSSNSAPVSGLYSGLLIPTDSKKKCETKKSSSSSSSKLKKGWRRLFCMA